MSEQTIHIKSPISRDELDLLITGLEAACGGNRIIVSESYDLVVSDDRQSAALSALFSSRQSDKSHIKRGPNKPKPKTEYIPIIRKPISAWQVLDILGRITENITIDEKNRRLAHGLFSPDTILHHPKAGRQRVTGPQGQPQGLEPS